LESNFENPFVKAKKEAIKTTLRLIEKAGTEGILNEELQATLGIYGYSDKTIKNYIRNLHTLKMISWKDNRWFYLKG